MAGWLNLSSGGSMELCVHFHIPAFGAHACLPVIHLYLFPLYAMPKFAQLFFLLRCSR